MREIMLEIPSPVLILMIVGVSALSAIAATYFVRARVDARVHQANNEVAGFMFAAIATVYGVLLAFSVLVVWQTFEETQVTVEQEVNALVDMYRVAQELPAPYGDQIQAYTEDYVRTVLDDEWATMRHGRASPKTAAALEQLWSAHHQLHAGNSADRALETDLLHALQEVGNQRRIRLLQSRSELPTLLWLVLIGGGVITLGFALFFRAPNARAHLLMTAMFAGLVAFILLLILELDNPFSGSPRIQPHAFEQALELFQTLGAK